MADGPISSRSALTATGVTDPPDIRFGLDNLQGATPASNQMSLPELSKAIGNVINKDTVAEMLALTGVPDGTRVDTARYSTSHAVGDGSGNTYVYDADSTATIDGGFVMPGVGGSLSWHLGDGIVQSQSAADAVTLDATASATDDYYNGREMRFAFPAVRGSSQSSSATTVTLAAGASAVDDYYNGRVITVSATEETGTVDASGSSTTTVNLGAGASAVDYYYNGRELSVIGIPGSRTVSDYNGTTKIATLSAALLESPSGGEDWLIEGVYYDRTVSDYNGTTKIAALSSAVSTFTNEYDINAVELHRTISDYDGTTKVATLTAGLTYAATGVSHYLSRPIMSGNVGTGRWVVQSQNVVDCRKFGAIADDSTDSSSELLLAVDTFKSGGVDEFVFDSGVYRTSASLDFGAITGTKIIGGGLFNPVTAIANPSWKNAATALKWTGVNGGTIMRMRGHGNYVDGINFVGNGKLPTGILVGNTSGIAGGHHEFGRLLFSEIQTSAWCHGTHPDFESVSSAFNAADCAFRYVELVNSTYGLRASGPQHMNYMIDRLYCQNVVNPLRIDAGGGIHVKFVHWVNSDLLMDIRGDGSQTGDDQSDFVVDFVKCDAQQSYGTPRLVRVTNPAAGGSRRVHINGVRLQGHAEDGRYILDNAGQCEMYMRHAVNLSLTNGGLSRQRCNIGTALCSTIVENCELKASDAAWYSDLGSSFCYQSGTQSANNLLVIRNCTREDDFGVWPERRIGSLRVPGKHVIRTTTGAGPFDNWAFTTNTNKSYAVQVSAVGRDTSGNTCSYCLRGTFKNASGTVSQIGSTTVLHSAEDAALSSANFEFLASGVNVIGRATGVTSTTITWVVDWDVQEID